MELEEIIQQLESKLARQLSPVSAKYMKQDAYLFSEILPLLRELEKRRLWTASPTHYSQDAILSAAALDSTVGLEQQTKDTIVRDLANAAYKDGYIYFTKKTLDIGTRITGHLLAVRPKTIPEEDYTNGTMA